MPSPSTALFDLEEKFWQSIVDEDVDTAIDMLVEPALMVSAHGVYKFDHSGYRRAAEEGAMVLKRYELSDMDAIFPKEDLAIVTYKVKQVVSPRGQGDEVKQEMMNSSTWTRAQGKWRCAIHTETPIESMQKAESAQKPASTKKPKSN